MNLHLCRMLPVYSMDCELVGCINRGMVKRLLQEHLCLLTQ